MSEPLPWDEMLKAAERASQIEQAARMIGVLAIEYQARNLTPTRMADRTIEILLEYGIIRKKEQP